MLRVYVDSQTIPAPPATCRTLGELVSMVTRTHLGDGRIVQKLVVNGQNCFTQSPEYVDFVMNDPEHYRQVWTVEITSSSTAAVARESITGAIEYSEILLMGLQTIAQKLRSGQLQEAFHFYTAAVKGIVSLMELLSSLETVLAADFTRIVVNGLSLRASLDGITAQVQALVAAQERNDLVTMADLLEFDIHDTIGQWKLALHDLACTAAGGPESASPGPKPANSSVLSGLQVPTPASPRFL